MRTKRGASKTRDRRGTPSSRTLSPLAAHVVALQRLAGNQAVTAMLQRDKKTQDDGPPPVATVLTKSLGRVGVESYQFPITRGLGSNGARARGSEKEHPGEMTFSSHLGDHSINLRRASLSGRAEDASVITPTLTVTLADALVSSYTVGGSGDAGHENWTLSYGDITIDYGKPGEKK